MLIGLYDKVFFFIIFHGIFVSRHETEWNVTEWNVLFFFAHSVSTCRHCITWFIWEWADVFTVPSFYSPFRLVYERERLAISYSVQCTAGVCTYTVHKSVMNSAMLKQRTLSMWYIKYVCVCVSVYSSSTQIKIIRWWSSQMSPCNNHGYFMHIYKFESPTPH